MRACRPGSDDSGQRRAAPPRSSCGAPAEQQHASVGPRGFFETLFGAAAQRASRNSRSCPRASRSSPERRRAAVARRPPPGLRAHLRRLLLPARPTRPAAAQNADEMCQALCPGAETRPSRCPAATTRMNRAISLSGRPYASHADAFKYQKTLRRLLRLQEGGESWAMLLRRAESMLDQRSGDIIVTAEKAEELSRPKVVGPGAAKKPATRRKPGRGRQGRGEAAAAETAPPRRPRARNPPASARNRSRAAASSTEDRGRRSDEVTSRTARSAPSASSRPNIIPVPEARKP